MSRTLRKPSPWLHDKREIRNRRRTPKRSGGELIPEGTGESNAQAEEEQSSHAFANYREDDFKPPSYEEMEAEMAQLRARP